MHDRHLRNDRTALTSNGNACTDTRTMPNTVTDPTPEQIAWDGLNARLREHIAKLPDGASYTHLHELIDLHTKLGPRPANPSGNTVVVNAYFSGPCDPAAVRVAIRDALEDIDSAGRPG